VISYNNYYGVKIFAGVGKESTVHDNVIQNNTTYQNISFGIDVDYCGTNNIVQNNTSYSNGEHGIAIEGTTNGAILRYNLTHSNGGTNPNIGGIALDGTVGVGVYSNLLYNEPNGVWLINGSQNAKIYSNTIYGSRDCFVVDSGGATGIVLMNNIAANCSDAMLQVAAGSTPVWSPTITIGASMARLNCSGAAVLTT
jgi:parallel beta-helix repeat protein